MRALLVAPILIAVLMIPPAFARAGGGGGHGGGGHGGSGGFHSTTRGFGHRAGIARGPNFARHEQHVFPNRFGRNGFHTGVQTGVPVWWGWPIDGGYAPPVQAPQAPQAPVQPQVIVIHTDDQGRMQTAEPAPDYGYVKGCHAIPNGYHCEPPTNQ